MSKCHFIVIKKKKQPNKQTPQTKSTPDQNTPESTNCCKQTQMQEQSFSVAVVTAASGLQAGLCILRKVDLAGVPVVSPTEEDNSPLSAP